MLSRGTTAPSAPAPPPAPPPQVQEKQGGFKQVVVPLSPAPQPATPVNGASSRESVVETPNGDLSAKHRADVPTHATPVDADAVLQGAEADEDEDAPPTPEKDDAVGDSLTPVPNPAVVAASEA